MARQSPPAAGGLSSDQNEARAVTIITMGIVAVTATQGMIKPSMRYPFMG